MHSGTTVKGKMESWNTEGLSLRQVNDKVVKLAKSDVAQVAIATGWSRGRKAAYGLLIGAGAGAGFLGGTCAASAGCDVPPAAMAAGGALAVGGIAAGVAALFPQRREVIYTANSAGAASPVDKQRVAADAGSQALRK